jgi:hypothetical protein
MDTFLPPIEKPDGLMLKVAYYFTRLKFGKVLTPLKVYSARLPSSFGLFYAKVSKLDRKLSLHREIVFLIREQVARINICHFCTDIGRWLSIQKIFDGEPEVRPYGTGVLLEDLYGNKIFMNQEPAAVDT